MADLTIKELNEIINNLTAPLKDVNALQQQIITSTVETVEYTKSAVDEIKKSLDELKEANEKIDCSSINKAIQFIIGIQFFFDKYRYIFWILVGIFLLSTGIGGLESFVKFLRSKLFVGGI